MEIAVARLDARDAGRAADLSQLTSVLAVQVPVRLNAAAVTLQVRSVLLRIRRMESGEHVLGMGMTILLQEAAKQKAKDGAAIHAVSRGFPVRNMIMQLEVRCQLCPCIGGGQEGTMFQADKFLGCQNNLIRFSELKSSPKQWLMVCNSEIEDTMTSLRRALIIRLIEADSSLMCASEW
jgi:hypothetical protein